MIPREFLGNPVRGGGNPVRGWGTQGNPGTPRDIQGCGFGSRLRASRDCIAPLGARPGPPQRGSFCKDLRVARTCSTSSCTPGKPVVLGFQCSYASQHLSTLYCHKHCRVQGRYRTRLIMTSEIRNLHDSALIRPLEESLH